MHAITILNGVMQFLHDHCVYNAIWWLARIMISAGVGKAAVPLYWCKLFFGWGLTFSTQYFFYTDKLQAIPSSFFSVFFLGCVVCIVCEIILQMGQDNVM